MFSGVYESLDETFKVAYFIFMALLAVWIFASLFDVVYNFIKRKTPKEK